MNGDEIRARRRARELVGEMHWRGIAVPLVYAHLADEFQDLVRSGDYAAWLATNQRTAHVAGSSRVGGISVLTQPGRSGGPRATRGAQPASAGVQLDVT